jgi:hypothetical protein
MRRRHYGKPLPPKRQVRAHLAFLATVKKANEMTIRIEVNEKQLDYLVRLIAADFQRMNALMDHAICHGSEVVLPDFDVAADILRSLEYDRA